MRMSVLDRNQVKAQRDLEKKIAKDQLRLEVKRAKVGLSALDMDQIKAQREFEKKITKDQLEWEIKVAKASGTYLGKRKVR